MDYRYTMPQGFMDDPSVPVKWRLYGIINGFWLSGKSCYGGNKFFSEKLGVGERQIRSALSQLEEEKLLRREVHGTSRNILPYGSVREAEVGVPPGGSGASGEAEVGVPHNSDSNSDSKTVALEDEPREVLVSDSDEERPKKLPKDEKALSLCRWAEQRRGFPFTSTAAQLGAIGRAKRAAISPTRLKERWEELEGETWRNGFDWVDVVKSFDKRA